MRCNLNACVVALCVFTIGLHLYLHTHQREALRPAPELRDHHRPKPPRPPRSPSRIRVSKWGGRLRIGRSRQNREKDRAIGKASMWDRRYAHSPRPPHNATVDDWLPQFGGVCTPTGEDEDDDDRVVVVAQDSGLLIPARRAASSAAKPAPEISCGGHAYRADGPPRVERGDIRLCRELLLLRSAPPVTT